MLLNPEENRICDFFLELFQSIRRLLKMWI